MKSIREQIISAVMNTLVPVATKHSAVLVRRPVDAYSEDDAPRVLAIFPESDAPSGAGKINTVATRTLSFRVVPQVFDLVETDEIADAMLADVHEALFQNRSFGGLAQALRQSDCQWLVEGGVVPVGQIPQAYEIDYRTLENDISKKG